MTIGRCDEVTRLMLQTTFTELFEQRVALEGIVLKPNMIVCRQRQRPTKLASMKSPNARSPR